LNYPNPFVNYTEFWFTQQTLQNLRGSSQVMTITGKVVWTKKSNHHNRRFLSKEITWDGKMILETK
jgi:hypothetical protein